MKEREKNINVWLPPTHPLLGTWLETQACAPDWESHWRPFDSQAVTQSIEPHQPGLESIPLHTARNQSVQTIEKNK